MTLDANFLIGAIAVGLGATLVMDLWNLFLKRAFGIPSLSYCLLGRWLRHMPGGTFRHPSIAAAPKKSFECKVGWIAHYTIGVGFALGLMVLTSGGWLARPTLLPALLYGIATVVFPFFIMQPSLGFGMAASKTPKPAQARLKSLMTHTVFGVGLYVCGLGVSSVPAHGGAAPASYLFVWAGDADREASDFLGVIDADPKSAEYGKIVASLPVGDVGTYPHHTEHEMPANGHLLANGFGAGKTWLFDLTRPLEPRILASFGDLAGFSHPHTFIRLANGNVMATFQYRATPGGVTVAHHHAGSPEAAPATAAETSESATGGLVEMDETGRVIRSAAASDPAIADKYIYPYSVLPMPAIDRAVSTTTDMNDGNLKATSQWVQLWRWSDLELLRSIALPPGPRGDEQKLTGEPRLLADGKSVYIHTFDCGLYLLRDIDRPEPTVRFVHGFEGINCGVPVLTGNYWLQPVPDVHALVSLDISNPEAPREVSRVGFGEDEKPHWIAIDPAGRRVVLNSAGGNKSNRLFVIDFDPATGKLAIDSRFRDAGGSQPGVDLTGKTWPHGFTGKAAPHGTVFSR